LKSKEDSYLSNFCTKSKIKFYELLGKAELAFSLIENNLEIADIRKIRMKEYIAAKDKKGQNNYFMTALPLPPKKNIQRLFQVEKFIH
jgi:hypothetical protein